MTEMKKCPKCGEKKPVSEFPKNKSQSGGLDVYCKSCRAKRQRKYRKENVAAEIERVRRYQRCVKNPSCPAVGGGGAEFLLFACEVCGKEFRRNKSYVDGMYKHKGTFPRFCSNNCKNFAQRNYYRSRRDHPTPSSEGPQ